MILPTLIKLSSEAEYKQYFVDNYCNTCPIHTFDGIPVMFYPEMFEHSFYKRSAPNWRAPKKNLDVSRCERMDWIRAVLQEPTIKPRMGFDKARKTYDSNRRVAFFAPNNYLVVIRVDNKFVWRFTTAYLVDNAVAASKILSSPYWKK